jgi:uncharacterized tellurite resistance protein B-like protein
VIERIKALLAGRPVEPQPEGQDELTFACVMLLVEAARMDQRIDPRERAVIERLLAERFGLGREAATALIEAALARAEASNRFFDYTRHVKDGLDEAGRVRMIEMMWEVVLADGRLDPYEDNLLRRVAGLIYVSDAESGAARQRVKARRAAGESNGAK